MAWNSAYKDLQDALATAAADPLFHAIHLAEGHYRPDGESLDRSLSFVMLDGLHLLGGFPSGGADLTARDPAAFRSVLSGDLLGDDGVPGPFGAIPGSLDNSYHVLRLSNLSGGTLMDGVEVRSGNANGFSDQFGGGALVEGGNPRFVNCTFVRNSALRSGGGLAMENSSASVEHCTFRENISGQFGGGVWVGGILPARITHCSFEDNGGCQGAGLAVGPLTFQDPAGSATTVLDCRFLGNQTAIGSSSGGGAFLRKSPVIMARCEFRGNVAQGGGGLYIDSGHAFVEECRFERNEAGGDGGGALFLGNFANIAVDTSLITSCLMIGNNGVAVAVQSSAEFTNCTLADNRNVGPVHAAQWPAFVNQGSSVVFANSIVWGHTAFGSQGDERDHLIASGSGSYELRNCIIEDWVGVLPGDALDANPAFKDVVGPDGNPLSVADNDYALLDSSPGVDGGLATWLPPHALADVMGQARVRDGNGDGLLAVDVGAFELALPDTFGDSFCGPAARGSHGLSSTLFALGSDIAVDNQITLLAEFLPLQQFGYFLNSLGQGLIVQPGGSIGNLCLGGGHSIGRHNRSFEIRNSGTMGSFGLQLDLQDMPSPSGATPVLSGQTWHFQAWHRDTDANGQSFSNFTNGLSIAFQ